MNVLIVTDILNGHNGTFKIMRNIAYGFSKNHNVRLLFFGKSNDYKNVLSLLDGLDYDIISYQIIDKLELPFKILITKTHSNFNYDDIPSFFGQFFLTRHLNKTKFNPDLIIFSSYFASGSLIINRYHKNIVFLHEAPLFDDFRLIIKKIMQTYVKFIGHRAKFLSISENTTLKTNKKFEFNITTLPPIAFPELVEEYKKEKIILVDTRWTSDRQPEFILEIAYRIKRFKIIMHGVFTDQKLHSKLSDKIKSKVPNIEMIANDSDEDLQNLYKKAIIVLRWSGKHETGNSLSIINAISYNCIPIVDQDLGIASFVSNNISKDLVVKRDPECFAKIIFKLSEDTRYYTKIQQNVINCRKKFSWENYALELTKII
jgi:glycosyltransferase involved in cell wall biosynthesis